MEKKYWTSTEIRQLYRIDERYKSIQTLYNAEERNEIPKAERISRGKIQVRNWTLEQLPAVGKRFGFLKAPATQQVICQYLEKAQVLKTSTTFNIALALALNGIKTIIIGLDYECSITDLVQLESQKLSLENNVEPMGLYHFFTQNVPIDQIIKKTSLPTLDIIPENHELISLNKLLNSEENSEYLFKNKLLPLLKEYEIIFFDNGNSWNKLVENSIICSKSIIAPLACNLRAYNAAPTNLSTILEFQEKRALNDQEIIMFPTLLEKSTISQQIYAQYLSKFSEYLIPIPIRSSVIGQEALKLRKTIFEYNVLSPLSQDYYSLTIALWQKICNEKAGAHKAISKIVPFEEELLS